VLLALLRVYEVAIANISTTCLIVLLHGVCFIRRYHWSKSC